MRATALAVTIAVAALIGGDAHAAGSKAQRLVAEAQQQWRDLEWEAVVATTDRALAASDATDDDRLEALRLKGSALVVLERTDEAIAAFELLFALDPDYELPGNTSPRITAVYEPARARWQVAQEERLATELGADLAALTMTVALPARPVGGQPLVVSVDVVDPAAIADRIVLSYRRKGSKHWSTVTAASKGRVSLTIPGTFTASDRGYVLELHVRLRHRSGVTLRRDGTADAPRQLAVAAGRVPGPTPVTRRWWFWAGAGTLAAAAVVIPILIDRSTDVGPQDIVLVWP